MELPRKLAFPSPSAALAGAAQKWPHNEFLTVLSETARAYGIEARSYTFSQTLSEVARLRAAYESAGIGARHRVGLMLENRPAFFFHWLALNTLGASAVPLNADWRSAELEFVMGHSEMAMAIVPPARAKAIAGTARDARLAVATATESSLLQGETRVATAVGSGDAAGGETPSDVECALLYTSGTTGRPKGCVLSNEYFVWAGQWYTAIGGLCEVRPGVERMLTPLPTAHMNAMACSTMCMLLAGGCLVPLDRFHPTTWWASVRESRATIVHYLGVMPAILLAAPPSPQERQHEVRFGFGAGVGATQHAAFEQRFGFPLLEAWAMTETGAGAVIIANREPRQVGTACFGRPEPAVEVRIGEEMPGQPAIGTPGELQVRAAGPDPRFGFFSRYLKDDAATREAWDGGWFHTGDIVLRDAQGQLHFVDRKKNLIRRSGENISAVEVEGVMARHPLVAAIGVAAVPDEIRGEEVLACIVATRALAPEERERLAEEIVSFGLGQLAYFKVPGYVHFCEALPRTATEKIQRGELKRLAQEALAGKLVVDTRRLKKRGAGA